MSTRVRTIYIDLYIYIFTACCTDERNSGGSSDVYYTPTADNYRILY